MSSRQQNTAPSRTPASTESSAPKGIKGLQRVTVALLDKMLGHPIPVLDQGFVRVIDYMGDDLAIVQAARVSYGSGTKHLRSDRGLIRYLMRHHHTTPFEMCEIKFHVRVPMDCWRQWIRHRTANINEYSTRYSIAIDAAQRTPPDKWRMQTSVSRQGSSGYLPASIGKRLSTAEKKLHETARDTYESRIARGVSREQARKDLPLSTYTEAYWKIDLHNLLHFLDLRTDRHAQEEIRAYANVIGDQVVAKWVPLAWEAFLDYRRNAVKLSRIESQIIGAIASNSGDTALRLASESGLLDYKESGILAPNRERDELEIKLQDLGLQIPWRTIKSNKK